MILFFWKFSDLMWGLATAITDVQAGGMGAAAACICGRLTCALLLFCTVTLPAFIPKMTHLPPLGGTMPRCS